MPALLAMTLLAPCDIHAADKKHEAIGTWTGTSTCIGYRPACKNEIVVYRFVPIDGGSKRLRLLGDKILDGKRVPMGALDCDVDGAHLNCEFRIGTTHGIWEYTVAGDSMDGTLIILPSREVGRRVKVQRTVEEKVPPAPSIEDYGIDHKK